jgi:hypothetical protein
MCSGSVISGRSSATVATSKAASAARPKGSARMNAPTRLASPVATFASSPDRWLADAPPCGSRMRRVSWMRSSCAACSAARSEPVGAGKAEEDDRQHGDPPHQLRNRAGGHRAVHDDADEHRHQCLPGLVRRGQCGGDAEVLPAPADRPEQQRPP